MAFLLAWLKIPGVKGWLRWGNRKFLVPVRVGLCIYTLDVLFVQSDLDISQPGKFAKAAILVDIGLITFRAAYGNVKLLHDWTG